MNFGNLFKIAMKAINNNKLRTLLTMLGIIIGVASVIAMLAIGQGSKQSIQDQISEMGSNMIMINPGNREKGGGGVRMSSSDMQTLKNEDYEAIRDKCTNYVSCISPVVNSSGQFINGSNNYPSSMTGVSLDYLEIRKLSVSEGEMFTQQDIATSAKVCVLGKTIVDNVFPNEDPIGQTVRFGKIPFKVVGVLKAKGYNSMGQDQDAVALAPYTTVQKRVSSITYLNGIYASAKTEGVTSKAIDDITELLRENHRIKEWDDNDFSIRSQEELSSMMTSTSDMMTKLLACVAGISLIVGGIGIMNIMYVSVTERTREIGLRMSVGARGVDILAQFLIEAVMISVTGGLIGVIFGVGASYLLKLVLGWAIYVQPYSVVLSFLVCTLTGIFFGWYPAKRASELDPIEAIRYE